MEPKRPFVFQEVLRRAGRRDVNAGVGTRLPAVHYGREKGHHDTHVGRQVWGAQHLQSDQAIQHAIHKHRRTQLTQPPAKVIQRESPDTCGKTCAQAKANSHNRTPNLSETQPLLPTISQQETILTATSMLWNASVQILSLQQAVFSPSGRKHGEAQGSR